MDNLHAYGFQHRLAKPLKAAVLPFNYGVPEPRRALLTGHRF
jgi:hypothetical protein